MTFAVGNVAGGTHAGWKRQKPKPEPWECDCPGEVVVEGLTMAREQPAYMARCTDCGTRRP